MSSFGGGTQGGHVVCRAHNGLALLEGLGLLLGRHNHRLLELLARSEGCRGLEGTKGRCGAEGAHRFLADGVGAICEICRFLTDLLYRESAIW